MIDFSPETMKARKKWHIFQVLKEKYHHQQTLFPVKISFRNKEKIKAFSDEWKLQDFVTRRPTVKDWLNKVLQTDRK